MRDPSIVAFKRVRRDERILSMHQRAEDEERVNSTLALLEQDSEAYENTSPTSWRGVMLKAKEAIKCLVASEDEEMLANALRLFFRERRNVDKVWLRDLRALAKTVKVRAPENGYAFVCLRSILKGPFRPHLV
jgi:hypothetical protein